MPDHFELFGIARGYALDEAALEAAYRELQAQVHPDRHAQAGDAQRRASIQWATRVNEAYRTLRDPLARARYLLALNGLESAFETDTAMPADFLMQQMELREKLEEAGRARDAAALDALDAEIVGAKRALHERLAERLDAAHDYAGAVGLVKKLMFLDRLAAEVQDAFEALEA